MHSQPKNRRDNRGQGQGQYQGSPGQRGRGQGGRGQGGRGQGNRGQGGRGQGPNRPAPLMQIPRRNFDNFPRPMMFQRPGFPRNNNVRPLFQQSPRMTMRDEMMFHQRRMSPESRHKILINPHFRGTVRPLAWDPNRQDHNNRMQSPANQPMPHMQPQNRRESITNSQQISR